MARKIHQIAKELGLKSKDLVDRCKAEGIPNIENHMSTVSAGLEATIQTWFAEGAQSKTDGAGTASLTAGREATKVAARKVRGTARKKKVETEPEQPAGVDPAVAAWEATKAVAKVRRDASEAVVHPVQRGGRKATASGGESVGAGDAAITTLTPNGAGGSVGGGILISETPSAAAEIEAAQGGASDIAAIESGAAVEMADTTLVDTSLTTNASSGAQEYQGTLSRDIDMHGRDIGVKAPLGSSRSRLIGRGASADDQSQLPGSGASVSGTEHDGANGVALDDADRSATAADTAGRVGGATSLASSRAVAIPNVPERPKIVRPAGPMLGEVQSPARVSGPTVVRIEEAEVVDMPRSRTRPRSDSVPGEGGRGGLGGGGGVRSDNGGPSTDPSRRNTRRKTRAGREGRSAFAAEGGGKSPRHHNWGEQDLMEREERLKGSHGYIRTIRRDAHRSDHSGERAKTAKQTGGVVKIQEPFTIKELSNVTGIQVSEIVMAMIKKGIMAANPNAGMPTDLAMELMFNWGIELAVEERKSAEDKVAELFKSRESVDVQPRSPVVAILGHVDHGKTSLLDRIRHANVAAGEAGGITQHTSAFRVNVRAGDADKSIVFLDTPGHEAFTEMRARGAKITDIVVLVVAADDGVMPQTEESIAHAKAADVPIIVVLNKIDKPEATDSNLQRIYGQLANLDLAPVEWGGKTEVVKCSALKGIGIQDVLDTIDYQAQLMELTADQGGTARGTVIEARMVDGRGPVANVLIEEGHIKVGDFVVIGRAYGRVRDMTDDRGKRLREAGPSTPLEISGLSAVPDAGDRAYVVDSLRMAEQAAAQRQAEERERSLAAPRVTLDNIFSQMKSSDRKELNLVLRADVQGSVETLRSALEEISTDELNVHVLHAAVGGITESDILLAEASGAIALGFHVIASSRARELADHKHVEIRTYQIIYELLDDVRKAAAGLLAPEIREEVLGHALVREVFRISRVGMVAGCYCTDGVIERNARIRVTRNDIVIEDNRVLEQLKRFKDDVREVRSGQECGMKIDGYDDIKEGDVLECFKRIEVQRQL